ncbi:hypothetical protein DMH12_38090 [Streptomyces sp. WAC 04229]|uniref:hypothetical protein n=1 Tax=Streptomyces sp. WAC 04229 TaxID=2203206 RepID=UPI000F736116|nr:hypothetical protein [Streptomyces sp. WAC 04229]RSN38336.1 hypothetical protein DMH12_38090 [Streptomyces sp. WAC 04229]
MLTDIHTTIGRVPVYAWAALLTLLFLGAITFGYRAAKNRTPRPRKTPDKQKRRHLTGFLGMSLVVTAGLALSTNTSARFAEKRLNMDSPWHITIGLVLEAIVLGLSIYSWAFNDKGAARVVYLLVLAQAIGAIEVVRQENEDLGTALVRIVGPVMLAYGLHKLLGLESKLGKIEIRSDGILARLWTDQKNRLESRLGIGARGADAAAISRANAADKFINLNSVGKPKLMTDHQYKRALVKAGRAALHGLEGIERQMAEANLVDRIAYEKGMQMGGAHFETAVMRGVRSNTGATIPDAVPPLGFSPLTSAATEAAPAGQTETTPEPHTDKPQPRSNPATTDVERKARAFDVYADLGQPSQRSFIKAWRGRGYGETDQTLRELYNEMHAAFEKSRNTSAGESE